LDQATVWTGSELIIWGGLDGAQFSGAHPNALADGASYNPTTDSWQSLPNGPLSGRGATVSAWTGAEVVLLGGGSASGEYYTDAAAFNPKAGTWRSIPVPTPPGGHPLTWRAAVFADSQLLAWSEWATSHQIGPAKEMGGADLFSYSPAESTWRLVPTSSEALPDVEEVLVANDQVIVRGVTINCGYCSRPFVAEATAVYNPVKRSWTRLPPDPLGVDHLESAWTGTALFSFNPSTTVDTTPPGGASAYEPTTHQWIRLPAAPAGCAAPEPPIWMGRGVVVYCSELFPKTGITAGLGLVFEMS
jgi:hypothetical protein